MKALLLLPSVHAHFRHRGAASSRADKEVRTKSCRGTTSSPARSEVRGESIFLPIKLQPAVVHL